MAKIKKAKAKGPDPPAKSQSATTAVPAVLPAALHPSGHDVHAKPSIAHEADAHGWGAPVHADEHGGDDGWGDDGASASVSASADGWGAPSHSAPGQAAGDGWGAPAPGGWGTSSPAPGAGDEWSASGPPAHGWGQPPPQSNQLGMYNLSRGQGAKKGSARRNPPAQTSAAQAPVSLHPSQAVAMTSPQGWGAPSAPGWGEPAAAWGQPPAPKPPVAKPAWANWASEAKMSPPQQRHQPAAVQQPFDPMHVNAQLIAQQEGILRSIQEGNARGGRAPRGHPQPPVQPPPGAWQQWGREAWGTDRASTIPEEDEDYEEEGDWEDEGDDGWGQPYPHNQRVRFSSNVSYASQSPRSASRAPAHNAQAPQTPAQASVRSLPRSAAHSIPGGWKPSPISSRTMQMATGTIPMTTATVKTTVFELAPPRNGLGENAFVDSHGVALIPAERALYSRERPAKERFRWGFNPDKDPRVGSLLHWISAMSNGIANIGLQKFIESGERGALFSNADFRAPSTVGSSSQPAFDWIPLSQLQLTLDSTLQTSVTLYDPAFQVVVFVFLLSPSGKSMAIWRRRLDVPTAIREAHVNEILAVQAELKRSYPVYVDELPVSPDAATTPAPKKKKVRFAFLRKLFGRKKTTA